MAKEGELRHALSHEKRSVKENVASLLTRLRSPSSPERDDARSPKSRLHTAPFFSSPSASDIAPLSAYAEEPSCRSPPSSRSPFNSPSSLHSATPNSCARRARTATKIGVSFSPSVRFASCRQRGNLAIPRGDYANEEDSVVAAAAGADAGPYPISFFHFPTKPVSQASSDTAGPSPTRSRELKVYWSPKRQAVDDDDTDSAGSRTSSLPRSSTRSLSPVKSPVSLDGSSTYDIGFSMPSPLEVTLLEEEGTPRPHQQAPRAAPSPTWRRTRSPDVDLLALGPPVPKGQRRAEAACLGATVPSAEHTALASRLVYSQQLSSLDLRLRSRPTGEANEVNVRYTVAQDGDARGAAALDDGEPPLLRDRWYNVDVSAKNLAAVAATTSGKRKVSTPKTSKAFAAPLSPPPLPVSTRRTCSQLSWAESGGEASTWSLLSALSPTPHDDHDHYLNLEESLQALPHAASAAAVGANTTNNKAHHGGMTVELLTDDNVSSVTLRRRRTSSAAITKFMADVAASDAAASPHGHRSRQPSMASATASAKSSCSSYSYSLPSIPLPVYDRAIPAPPANPKGPTPVKATTTPAAAHMSTKAAVKDIGNLSYSDVHDVVAADAHASEQSAFPHTLLRNSKTISSSVTDAELIPTKAAHHGLPPPPKPRSLPLLTTPTLKRMSTTTPVSSSTLRLAAAAAAAAECGLSSLVLSNTSSPAARSNSASGSTHLAPGVSADAITHAAAHSASPNGGTPTHSTVRIPSLPAPSSRWSPRRSLELNPQPVDGINTGLGATAKNLAPQTALQSPRSAATPVSSGRAILPQRGNEEGEHRNGATPSPSLSSASPHSPPENVETKLHVLRGPAEGKEVLVIQAPVHPNLSLPRGSVVRALAHGHSSSGDATHHSSPPHTASQLPP